MTYKEELKPLAEKQETKVIFTPKDADNKEHRVTASDNSLVDIAPKEDGSVEVTEKGKVGSTHLEAETILDYENENLLEGTDEDWTEYEFSGWTAGRMTYTPEELGVKVGDTLTYSMEIDNTLDYENNTRVGALVNFYDSNHKVIDQINGSSIDTGYKGFRSGTRTIPEGTVKIQAYKAYKSNSGEGKNKIAKTRHQKLERGSEATPYTKAQSEVEDDPRIKRDSIPVNIKGERTLDFKNKVRGSEEENANKAELDIRDFENRNLLFFSDDADRTGISSNNRNAYPINKENKEENGNKFVRVTRSFEINESYRFSIYNTIQPSKISKDFTGGKVTVFTTVRASEPCTFSMFNEVKTGTGEKLDEYEEESFDTNWKTIHASFNLEKEFENLRFTPLKLNNPNEYDLEEFYLDIGRYWIVEGVVDATDGWHPSANDLGIPYGQPNLVNHSNYDSRELSEGITELVNDSFLEDTEAETGDTISGRIRGNLSGYYDGDILLQGYTNSGANTGEIARKKVNPKTPDQEIWLEEGEIPKDTERLGLYFNRDTDYSMSERNLLLKSEKPQSFKGNGQINQTRDVSYDLTPDLNESYGGEKFSLQTDIDVIGYDFGGTLYVQTRPNKYVTLFEENLRFENHENKLRNPGMNEEFSDHANLISGVDMYDYDLGSNGKDKIDYYEGNKFRWNFDSSDRNPGVRLQNTDTLKNNQDYTLSFDIDVEDGDLHQFGGYTLDFSDEYGYYSVDGRDYRENLLPKESSSESWQVTDINFLGASPFQYKLEDLELNTGETLTVQAEIDNSLDDKDQKDQIPFVSFRFLDENHDIIPPKHKDTETAVANGEKGISWASGTIPEGAVWIKSYIYRGSRDGTLTLAYRNRKLSRGDKPTVYSKPGLGSYYAPAPLPPKENLIVNAGLEGDTSNWGEWTSNEVNESDYTRVPLVEDSNIPEYAFKIHKEEGANGKMGVTQKGSDMNLEKDTQYVFSARVRVSDDSPVDTLRAVIEANYGQSEGNSEGYENQHLDVGKEWQTITLIADSKEGVLYRVGITNDYYGDLLIKDMNVEPVKRLYHVEAHIKSKEDAMDNRGLFLQPNRTSNKSDKPASKGVIRRIKLQEGTEFTGYSENILENIEDWDRWDRWGTLGHKYVNGTRKRKILDDPEDASKKVNGWEIEKYKGHDTNLGYQQNSIAVEANGYYALTLWARKHPDSENGSPMLRVRLGTFRGKDNEILPEIGEEWERLSLILKMPEDTSTITLFIGVAYDSYGKVQIARPKFERAEEHHRIEHMKPMSEEALKEIDAINTRADNLPSSLEVTLSNSKWELGDSISPYSQAPEDLDDPGQYSKLEDVEIQVIKGPKEAQDDWKPSYVDFYQKTMLQSQARTAIGTLPNLPSLENYTPFKAPKKSLPSSLTYSSVPKFDPKVELPQGHYDKLNTDGESIKAKTKLVGQNAEFTLIFDTVRFTEEAFPELFEGTTNMKEKRERYHEIATFQEVFVTARGNNGVEDKVYVKFKIHLGSAWEENSSSSSSSSSLSEISRGLRKGNNFWDGRWVNGSGETLALVSTEDTQEFTEKELEVQSARLEVTIQPPENPNATPKTITVLPE